MSKVFIIFKKNEIPISAHIRDKRLLIETDTVEIIVDKVEDVQVTKK